MINVQLIHQSEKLVINPFIEGISKTVLLTLCHKCITISKQAGMWHKTPC